MTFREIAAIALDEAAMQDGDDYIEPVITEDDKKFYRRQMKRQKDQAKKGGSGNTGGTGGANPVNPSPASPAPASPGPTGTPDSPKPTTGKSGSGVAGKLAFDLQAHDKRFHGGHYDGKSVCKYRKKMAQSMQKAGIAPSAVPGLSSAGAAAGEGSAGGEGAAGPSEAEKTFMDLKTRYEQEGQTEISKEDFEKAQMDYITAELGQVEADAIAQLKELAKSNDETGQKAEEAAERILNDPNSSNAQREGAQVIQAARKEWKVNGKTYVDLSGMSFWDGMKAAFKAGYEGKDIVTDWDKMSGRWDVITSSDPKFKEANGLLQEGLKDALSDLGFGEDFDAALKTEGLTREQWQEIGYLKNQFDTAKSAKEKHAAWRQLKDFLKEQGLEKEEKGGKKDAGLRVPPKGVNLPPEDILDPPVGEKANQAYGDECKKYLEQELKKFGASATIPEGGVHVGPLSTEIVFEPGADFNYAKLRNGNVLDNITHGLKAKGRVVVEAKDDGSGQWSIKVSNPKRAYVTFNDVHATDEWKNFSNKAAVPLLIGKDATTGELIKADLAKLPHMIVGGATGQGKSVGLNSIINGITCDKTPEDVQLILCDPKRTEFTGYGKDPHLAMPVLTNPADIASGVKKLREEMNRRMDLLGLDADGAEAEQNNARSLDDYNRRVGAEGKLPRQVLIIDELAEATADKAVGDDLKADLKSILALGRALGIHVICATQRSDVNAIPGDLKNNMPARIAFKTATGVDSKTILDEYGAEKLTGEGDFLFKDGRGNKLRGQGARISDDEINRVQDFFRTGKSTPSPKRSGGGSPAPTPATTGAQTQGVSAANGAESSMGNTTQPQSGEAQPQQVIQPGQTVTNLTQSQVKRAEAMSDAQKKGNEDFNSRRKAKTPQQDANRKANLDTSGFADDEEEVK